MKEEVGSQQHREPKLYLAGRRVAVSTRPDFVWSVASGDNSPLLPMCS